MPKKADELGALDVKRLSDPGMYFVGGVAGLGLQISPSGAKAWVLRVWVGAKRRRMGLGGFPDVTLARARDLAREAREKVSNGIDPIDEKKSARRTLVASRLRDVTFQTCAEQHIESHRLGWSEKHGDQWASTLETYAYPIIGNMWVRDIKVEHLMQILEPEWATKTETLNRLRGRIEVVLDSAKAKGFREGMNPATLNGNLELFLPPKNKIAKVKHFPAVPVSEMPAFFEELRKIEGVSARALEMLILTNVRSHNVRHAAWSEIDFETKTWLIPGVATAPSEQRMKAGVSFRVPLSPAVISLLNNTVKTEGTDLIFPTPRKLVALSNMAMSKLMKVTGAKGVPHGFRSTFRVWAAEYTNVSREVVEQAMAHTLSNKTEAAYMRSDLFVKRTKLMELWATYCTTKPQADGKVVQMRSAS